MATQNLTRSGGDGVRNQKKCFSILRAELDYTDEVGTSADVYELFKVPANCWVRSYTRIVTASDAATTATADIGFAGGAELDNDVDLKGTAETITVGDVGLVHTATGKTITFTPTYTGATTAGKFEIVIELWEVTKNNGDYLNYSST